MQVLILTTYLLEEGLAPLDETPSALVVLLLLWSFFLMFTTLPHGNAE